MQGNQCDTCAYLEYDEDDEEYYCSVDMDEDDWAKQAYGDVKQSCPFYRDGDEYKVVRHQL